jgi:molybdenum cofactor cytidylyltransferase
MHARRLFAVIPAAGVSRRMGRPKLMLPLGDRTVIRRLLDVLARPGIAARVVVMRLDDAPLCAEVEAAGATVIQPEVAPPDMRTSVQHALDAIAERFDPQPDDGWLLIPADHPLLDANVLDQLIACWQASDASILLPEHAGERGHPTFFRWSLAEEVRSIPVDRGLNHLVAAHASEIETVSVETPAVLTDLDTPEDYERLRGMFEAGDAV